LTLVELIVAVGVLGILVAVAIPSLAELLERRRVTVIAQELASLLNFARSEANVNGDDVRVQLQTDPTGKLSCAMVNVASLFDVACACHREPTQLCGVVTVPVLRLFQLENANGVSFEASAASWGVREQALTFSRGRYQPEVSGVRIDVTGRRTRAQLRVELNDVRRVRICSPGGTMGGFPACE
jgi:Tfp pilus assembly protein FimT